MTSALIGVQILKRLQDVESLETACLHFAPQIVSSDEARRLGGITLEGALTKKAAQAFLSRSKKANIHEFVGRNTSDMTLLKELIKRERRSGVLNSILHNPSLDFEVYKIVVMRLNKLGVWPDDRALAHARKTLSANLSTVEILTKIKDHFVAGSDLVSDFLGFLLKRKNLSQADAVMILDYASNKSAVLHQLGERGDIFTLDYELIEPELLKAAKNHILTRGSSYHILTRLANSAYIFSDMELVGALLHKTTWGQVYNANLLLAANPLITDEVVKYILEGPQNPAVLRALSNNPSVDILVFADLNAEQYPEIFSSYMEKRLKGNMKAFEYALMLLETMKDATLEEVVQSALAL